MTKFSVPLCDRIKEIQQRDINVVAIIKKLLKDKFPAIKVEMKPGSSVLVLICPTKLQKISLMRAIPGYLSNMKCDRIVFKHGVNESAWDTSDMQKLINRLGK